MNKRHSYKKKPKLAFKVDEEGKGTKEIQRSYDESSPLIQNFLTFQKELDGRYDKRERLVKLSRDITIISKRVIFQLHRFSQCINSEEIVKEAEEKLETVKNLFEKIALELKNEDSYQYARAYTGGMQEFIEAVTFMHYIKSYELLSYEELCKDYLSFQDVDKEEFTLLLRPMDYILGVADLTGELMRMCINCLGNGEQEKSQEICSFLRTIHDESLKLSGKDFRDLGQKIRVMKQSMQKVENVCYAVSLRGKEVPKHMLIDLIKMKEKATVVEDSCIEN
eukprot:gene20405-22418_t